VRVKKVNKFILCGTLLLATISLSSCDNSFNDFSIGALSFTCIESDIGEELYVCDQTNVVYLKMPSITFVPLIKEDGTAYTLDDYKKDCSQAKIYREDI
jgi:hypothetical protein